MTKIKVQISSVVVAMFLLVVVVGMMPAPLRLVEVRRSCVLVQVVDGIHGSGVIVGRHEVLTARHVAVEPNLSVIMEDGTIYRVVKTINDDDCDAAILIVEEELLPVAILATDLVEQGDVVYGIGSPLSKELMNSFLWGHVVKIGLTVDYGEGLMKNLIIADFLGRPGCSGGGVFKDGRLIGIIVAGWADYDEIIPLSEFKELLACLSRS